MVPILRQTSGCIWEKVIPDAVADKWHDNSSCTHKIWEYIKALRISVSLSYAYGKLSITIIQTIGINEDGFGAYIVRQPARCFDGSIQYPIVLIQTYSPYRRWGKNGYAQVSDTVDDF